MLDIQRNYYMFCKLYTTWPTRVEALGLMEEILLTQLLRTPVETTAADFRNICEITNLVSYL